MVLREGWPWEGTKTIFSLSVLQRRPRSFRSLHMEITPELSRRNLWMWQHALEKLKDPLAWGRRSSVCIFVYIGEKTYVEIWRVRLQRDDVRHCTNVGELGKGPFLPSEQVACRAYTALQSNAVCSFPCSLVCFCIPAWTANTSTPHLLSAMSLLLPVAKRAKYAAHSDSLRVWKSILCVRSVKRGWPVALSLVPVTQMSLGELLRSF